MYGWVIRILKRRKKNKKKNTHTHTTKTQLMSVINKTFISHDVRCLVNIIHIFMLLLSQPRHTELRHPHAYGSRTCPNLFTDAQQWNETTLKAKVIDNITRLEMKHDRYTRYKAAKTPCTVGPETLNGLVYISHLLLDTGVCTRKTRPTLNL